MADRALLAGYPQHVLCQQLHNLTCALGLDRPFASSTLVHCVKSSLEIHIFSEFYIIENNILENDYEQQVIRKFDIGENKQENDVFAYL